MSSSAMSTGVTRTGLSGALRHRVMGLSGEFTDLDRALRQMGEDSLPLWVQVHHEDRVLSITNCSSGARPR